MSKENRLPQKVDPFRFADNAIQLEGVMVVEDMERLRPSLCHSGGKVKVTIAFGVDEQGNRFIKGHYSSCLALQCQRCMEAFDYEVSGYLALGIVETEEAADKLPASYEPLLVKDSVLILQDIIEDELILGLPVVPRHLINDCEITLPLLVVPDEPAHVEQESPFKIIELLRSKRNVNNE